MTDRVVVETNPATIGFWQRRWRSGETGWDQGCAHPLLAKLLAAASDAGVLPVPDAKNPVAAAPAKILEPGAGRAHNGAALAALGFSVTSFDGVAEAINGARELYGTRPHLTLAVADALTEKDEWRGTFDVIFDRAMFCALPAEARPAYAAACFAHLKPGGHFLSILFSRVVHIDGRLGPPFEVTMTELSHAMAPYFSVISADDCPVTPDTDRIKQETLVVMKRRDRALVESR